MAPTEIVLALLLALSMLYVVIDLYLESFGRPVIAGYAVSDVFETCPLSIYDPFYFDAGLIRSDRNPVASCRPKGAPTLLRNGVLTVNPNFTEVAHCRARCVEYRHANGVTHQAWRNATPGHPPFECDFVQAECFDRRNVSVQQYLHAQVVATNRTTVQRAEANVSSSIRPDVIILVFDSVASTQARRSLPRTLSFLESKFGGRHFHHLNKMGENTKPNAMAMFLGWRIYNSKRAAVGASYLSASVPKSQFCNAQLDNQTVVYREFEKIGYKTLYSDDYPSGTAFTWPNCKGFSRQETTHSFRMLDNQQTKYKVELRDRVNKLRLPFVNAMKDKALRSSQYSIECFEMFRSQLSYLEQFIRTYKGKSKFAINWSNTISHDDSSRLYHGDEYYHNFLRRNEELLDNAFVIVIGDHGPRFGPIARIRLHSRELNNPVLHLSVPKFLRSNTQENAARLVTQFDVHATLVDILNFAPQSNFTDFSYVETVDSTLNNATSLLRPFPEKFRRRTCRTIPVDAAFCLCEYKKAAVRDEAFRINASQFALDEVNKLLDFENASSLCEKYTLNKVLFVSEYVPAEKTNLYEVAISVKPGNGDFLVMFGLEDGAMKRKADVIRRNKYGTQSKCVEKVYDLLRPICYCKHQ